MGSILSEQEGSWNNESKNLQENPMKMSQNWQVLQKDQFKQILKSKRTALVVERHWFQTQNPEDVQLQSRLFQWRNNNPSAEFMVNVLSFSKDQFTQSTESFQCSSMSWCPSQKISNKLYAVTQRILKLDQIYDLIRFQSEMENIKEKGINKIIYATDEDVSKQRPKKYQKLMPFINICLTQNEVKQIIKDWVRGIQVLCYKFGYFKITSNNLGINPRKKGNVWISQNYSSNQVPANSKMQVWTAQQKFRYQKQTLQKIIQFSENIPWLTTVVNRFKHLRFGRFDQFCRMLDEDEKVEINITVNKSNQMKISCQAFTGKNKNNTSLFVQHGSFMYPNYNASNTSHNTSRNDPSFFLFDQKNRLRRVNSSQNLKVLNDSLKEEQGNQLIRSGKNHQIKENRQIKPMKTRIPNAGQKQIPVHDNLQLLYQCNHQQTNYFINSSHKHGGKQTAPTNYLGYSSLLQSGDINNYPTPNNFLACNYQQLYMSDKKRQGKFKGTFKKHGNNTLIQNLVYNQKLIYPNLQICPDSNNDKVYFHHFPSHKHSFSASNQPYLFRSQNNQSFDFIIPRIRHNSIEQYNIQKQDNKHRDKYYLDQNNITGPYQTQKFHQNLKNQKIILVDSMVMVHEQSQQIEEDIHNMSAGKIILEESIILMGRQNQVIGYP